MRKLAGLVCCLALAGCYAREIKVDVPFDPKEAAFINQKGKGSISGQAFLRRNDGVVVYAAGSEVKLVPATRYADARIGAIYGGAKYMNAMTAQMTKYPEEPEYMQMIKTTKANGEGRFTFNEIAPGQYYIVTGVQWCVPTRYGCDKQGGDLVDKVRIAGAETANIILDGK